MVKVTIYQSGKPVSTLEAAGGETLHEMITASGVFFDAPCGGHGRCKKCKVRLSPDGEEVLACQNVVTGPTDIYLPENLKMDIAESGKGIGAVSSKTWTGALGVGVDIGTTSVVTHLTDMETGARLATVSGVNAQRQFGADVISRIQYCMKEGNDTLTKLIRGQIGDFIKELCEKTGAEPEEIKAISIAGNTIMEHLYADLDPSGMGVVPFTPLSLFGTEGPAGDDLPVSKDCVVYLAPAVHSYVGGDITAGMLAAKLEQEKDACLFLDIGTNGEMVVKSGKTYYCCATAAGPAFEGAEISMGMAAVPGAINYVRWTGDGISYETVGNAPAKGICGSGLVDTLAMLLITGAVDETGRLLDAEDAPEEVRRFIDKVDGKNVFRLTEDVYMSAEDVRKIQLAKSAIASGIQTLLHSAGIKTVSAFLLAGGFGSYLDKTSGARIGLFPKEFLEVTRVLGNTAGEGAALALYSKQARAELSEIRSRCQYIELSASPYFMEQFVDQMMFEGREE